MAGSESVIHCTDPRGRIRIPNSVYGSKDPAPSQNVTDPELWLLRTYGRVYVPFCDFNTVQARVPRIVRNVTGLLYSDESFLDSGGLDLHHASYNAGDHPRTISRQVKYFFAFRISGGRFRLFPNGVGREGGRFSPIQTKEIAKATVFAFACRYCRFFKKVSGLVLNIIPSPTLGLSGYGTQFLFYFKCVKDDMKFGFRSTHS